MGTSELLTARAGLAGAALLATATPASAQSLSEIYFDGLAETRAVASIVIPLGGERQSSETKTRVDFAVTSLRHQANGNIPIRANRAFEAMTGPPVTAATSISLTLENRPSLLINKQAVARFGPNLYADESQKEGGSGDDEKGGGLSTGAGIAIGLGVLAGAVVAVGLETSDAIGDIFEPD